MTQEWITTRAAAELAKYHPEHIRKLIKSGKVKAQKFGQVWQVDGASLLAYTRAVAKLGAKPGPKPSA